MPKGTISRTLCVHFTLAVREYLSRCARISLSLCENISLAMREYLSRHARISLSLCENIPLAMREYHCANGAIKSKNAPPHRFSPMRQCVLILLYQTHKGRAYGLLACLLACLLANDCRNLLIPCQLSLPAFFCKFCGFRKFFSVDWSCIRPEYF